MLFSSLTFLLGFLPGSLLLLWIMERAFPAWRIPFLVVVSFVFYGFFDLRFAPLLAASIGANWCLSQAFVRTRRRGLVPAGIALNLLLLGVFKYFNFFAELSTWVTGTPAPLIDLALPVGISFFTFQHIMFLADLQAGRAEPVGLMRYALYVAFFPRVIAGPLVRPGEIMGQFDAPSFGRADTPERLAKGLALLTLGLAKKAFLADALAPSVDAVYALVASGGTPTVLEAWQAMVGYALQLYFDFSGYTDMALGIALLFGIALPQNFNAPYRATSIQDFWRRWHITLSHFLRDYLYIPMGGSRHGVARQLLALLVTMALGGLWHGAGLTFVAWGVAHGLALGVHVLWRKAGLRLPPALAVPLTFLFVALAWVLFRAPGFEAASVVYASLAGFAPFGSGGPWLLLAVAAIMAVCGPTAAALSARLPRLRWIGVALTGLSIAVLLRIGNDANQDFIYQQF